MRQFGVFILFILMLTAVTCRLPDDPFEAYRSVNLIADISLADWRVDDETGMYMTYEDVTGTEAPPPGNGDAEVYRLEIKSLLPNGKFDDGIGGWTDIGAETLEVVDDPDPGAINGKTLHFNSGQTTDQVIFNIKDAVNGAVDGFIENSSYLVRYDYRTRSSLVFEYNDSASPLGYWKVFGGEGGDASGFAPFELIVDFPPEKLEGSFPEKTAGSNPIYYYMFGSLVPADSQSQEGYIDNFRLIRTDIPYKIRLNLKQAGNTVEPLLSGTYRFFVSVKSEQGLTGTNKYLAKSVTLGVSGGNGEIRSTRYQDFHNESGWADWAVVYTDLFIQIPTEPGDEDVLELSICPSDDVHGSLNLDTGSLLVSSPGLSFHPEGTSE